MSIFDPVRVSYRAAGIVGITAATLGAYELSEKIIPSGDENARFHHYRAAWLAGLHRLFSLDIEVVGERQPHARGRLVVSNHRSALDIMVMMHLYPGYFLSRADIAGWPILGAAAARAGTIFVDREEGHSRAGAVRAIRAHIKKGHSVGVFPEGTTHAGDEVRPFHPGAFLATRGIDAEIVPVGLAYEPGVEYTEATFTAHLAKVAKRKSTRVVAVLGEPIKPDGDVRELATTVEKQVQALVYEARRRV